MKKVLSISLVVIFVILVLALFAYIRTAHVTIDATQTMAVMPLEGIGVATAVYEGNLADPASAAIAVPLLKAAGIGALRFPGGSYADIYNWQIASPMDGYKGWMPAQNHFTNFMNQLVIPSGTEAIITCNYGSNTNGTNAALDWGGDPNFAAAWVAFANVTNHWGIKYWEIGNEICGNGWSNYYFGTNKGWELDMHPDKSPMAYGSNVVLFAKAMKAVDPTIKIGVGICEPDNWQNTNASYPYNRCVLTNCANAVDFVIIHWYPSSTPVRTLAAPGQIPSIVQNTRVELTNYLGAARAGKVDIAITETSAGTTNTGVVATLFAADDYLSWIENGIVDVDYQEYHDDFLLTQNQHPGQAYYGAQMAHLLANIGDTLLRAASDRCKLRVHAALRRDGRVGIMLINENRNFSQNVHVIINGTNLAASGTRYQFGLANFVGDDPAPSDSVASNSVSGLGNSFSVTVPAYTMIDLLIPILTNSPSETPKTNFPHPK